MKKPAKSVTRREFLKKAALAAAALAAGAWGFSELLKRPTLPTVSGEHRAPRDLWKWSREAYDYTSFGDSVRCSLCPHTCSIQPEGRGICRVRVNKGGRLYSLAYGNPAAVHVDPVEKKPLFHFLPGSTSYSIGTAGCNFRCLNCQNWQLSQFTPEETENQDLMPDRVVAAALEAGSKSIAYTYSEPVVFYEYVLDTAKLAREAGVRNVMVTNGYINREPLKRLSEHLDAAHIDLKGFDNDVYMRLNAGTLQPVLDTLKAFHENRVWFEAIHLVVPTWTDKIDHFREMVKWLYSNIGPDHPLHISRFYPQYKLTNLPQTPTEYLLEAHKAALDEGLNYVYVGNAPELNLEDTICPKCGNVAVARRGYTVTEYNLEDGACKNCGEKIPGVWK